LWQCWLLITVVQNTAATACQDSFQRAASFASAHDTYSSHGTILSTLSSSQQPPCNCLEGVALTVFIDALKQMGPPQADHVRDQLLVRTDLLIVSRQSSSSILFMHGFADSFAWI
jgi:hypothetical protein